MNKKDIKVLVVDDTSSFRNTYTELVRACGYRAASDEGRFWKKTEKAIREYNPQVFLLDTNLAFSGGVTGMDICAYIRKMKGGDRVGIIGMSLDPCCRKEWKEAGADAFLEKAYIIKTLKPTLEEVLKKHYPDYNPQNKRTN